MKHLFMSPGASSRTLALAAVAIVVAPLGVPRVAQARPEQSVRGRARAFYSWYVGQVKRDKNPLDNRATMRRYISRRLEKWLYSPAFREYGADYFLDAQDFDNDWDKLRAGTLRVRGATATLHVTLGRPKPTGKGIGAHPLVLKWVREGGAWKIDRVNNN